LKSAPRSAHHRPERPGSPTDHGVSIPRQSAGQPLAAAVAQRLERQRAERPSGRCRASPPCPDAAAAARSAARGAGRRPHRRTPRSGLPRPCSVADRRSRGLAQVDQPGRAIGGERDGEEVRCAEADGRDVERYSTSALVDGRLRSPRGGFASRGRGRPGSGNRPQFQENAARGVASPPTGRPPLGPRRKAR
jgi:hypothetical protein